MPPLRISSSYTPSALRLAIKDKNLEAALGILKEGSCPDIENGRSHLQRAIKHFRGHATLAAALLEGRGIELIEFVDRKGETAMSIAACRLNTAAVDLLVKAGGSVHSSGRNERSPLQMASFTSLAAQDWQCCIMYPKTRELVQTFVRHGALVGIGDANRKRLLQDYLDHWKLTGGDPQLVSFLIAEGVPSPRLSELQKLASEWIDFKRSMRESQNQGQTILDVCDKSYWCGRARREGAANAHPLQVLISSRVGTEENDDMEIAKINRAVEEGHWLRKAERLIERELEFVIPTEVRKIVRDFVYPAVGPEFENDEPIPCSLL